MGKHRLPAVYVLTLVVGVLWTSMPTPAQEKASADSISAPAGQTANSLTQPLDLQVHVSRLSYLGDAFSLDIQVQNRSTDPNAIYTLQDIDVFLPEALAFCPDPNQDSSQISPISGNPASTLTQRGTVDCPRPAHLHLNNTQSGDLKANHSAFFHLECARVSFLAHPLKFLGYRSADYDISTQVHYWLGSPQNNGVLTQSTTVNPHSPLAAVIVGGLVGVLLSNFLMILNQLRAKEKSQIIPLSKEQRAASAATLQAESIVAQDSPPAGGEPGSFPSANGNSTDGLPAAAVLDSQLSGTTPRRICVNLLYGSLATAIAILLLALTTVSAFPISISVSDSFGGLIVGLFNQPVADFIYTKLFPIPS